VLNDTNIDHNNPIFDTLHEIYTGPPTSTAHIETNRDGTTTQPKIKRQIKTAQTEVNNQHGGRKDNRIILTSKYHYTIIDTTGINT
jgi:hypothetical protein